MLQPVEQYKHHQVVIGLYHSVDPDGWSSAWVVSKAIPQVKLFGYNYGNSIEALLRNIPADTELIVATDLTMSMELVDAIRGKAKQARLIWIDHHESTALLREQHPQLQEIEGTVRMGDSGCKLTFEWFYPELQLPYALFMVDRYDVRDIRYLPEIDIANLLFRSSEVRPYDKDWHLWDLWCQATKDEFIDDHMMPYQLVHSYLKNEHRVRARQSREVLIGGHKILACNVSGVGSNFFDSRVRPYHEATMTYYQTYQGMWKYTIYSNSEHFNARLLAESYGGGGHPGASGFTTKTLLSELQYRGE